MLNKRLTGINEILFLMKPVWAADTMLGRTFSRRQARTLARILVVIVSDTSYNREDLCAFFEVKNFGWNVMCWKKCPLLESANICFFENLLKNSTGNPLGPGHFPLCMAITASFTSDGVIGLSRFSTISSDTFCTGRFIQNLFNSQEIVLQKCKVIHKNSQVRSLLLLISEMFCEDVDCRRK